MRRISSKSGISYRARAKLQSLFGYLILMNRYRRESPHPAISQNDERFNEKLVGYPRNHNYYLHGGNLIPSFRLYERLRLIHSVLPKPLESFLDIGCCRGYYVIDAAQMPSCRYAVGIDVCEHFVETARAVLSRTSIQNAEFHVATLNELAAQPSKYKAPHQTILLIGTYHYLFWGSSISSFHYGDHRKIMEVLSTLCSHRIILSGRFELDRLPRGIRTTAMQSDKASKYNTKALVDSAKEFFSVRNAGFLGTYPLLVLDKKAGHHQ